MSQNYSYYGNSYYGMYDLPTAGLEQHASITPEERERLHQDVFGGEPDLAQDLFAPHPEPSCNADTSSTPARAAAPSAAAATISAAPPSASAATISAAPPSASATTVTGQDDYGQTVGRADETIGDLYRQKTSDAPQPRHHLAHHGDFLQRHRPHWKTDYVDMQAEYLQHANRHSLHAGAGETEHQHAQLYADPARGLAEDARREGDKLMQLQRSVASRHQSMHKDWQEDFSQRKDDYFHHHYNRGVDEKEPEGHDDSLSSVEAELAAQRQSCYTYNLPTRSLSPSRMACYVPPAPPMMMNYAPPVSPRMVSYAPAATPRMNYAPPVSPRMNYAPAGAYGGPMSHRAMFR